MQNMEYKLKLEQAFLIARLLLQLEGLPEIVEAMERAEHVGCYIDPTLWLRGVGAMQEQKKIVQALIAAKKEIEPARAKLFTEMARQRDQEPESVGGD